MKYAFFIAIIVGVFAVLLSFFYLDASDKDIVKEVIIMNQEVRAEKTQLKV